MTALNENFGYFPAGGDYYALENGWITEEDFLYQLEKQSTYMAEVAAWVFSTYQPDLMFTWQDPFDSAGHQFFMSDPRQLSYSPELAEIYQGYYQRAAKVADHSLSIMLDAIDLGKTTVLMVGDHGMAPIHTSVFVNTILEQAGLLTLDSQNVVVVNETKAFAIASGGSAHIYINLVGREKEGGIVTAEEYPAIVEQIVELFTQSGRSRHRRSGFPARPDEKSTWNPSGLITQIQEMYLPRQIPGMPWMAGGEMTSFSHRSIITASTAMTAACLKCIPFLLLPAPECPNRYNHPARKGGRLCTDHCPFTLLSAGSPPLTAHRSHSSYNHDPYNLSSS